jgi:osmotically-inducible protein OsmY
VRAAILEEIRLSGARTHFVDIVVTGGVVQLWGGVETSAEKEAIRTAAEATPGVKSIEDNLAILSEIVRPALWSE